MLRIGALVLGGVALVCFLAYPYLYRQAPRPGEIPIAARPSACEVRSVSGAVDVRRRGETTWRTAGTGMELFAGDLIRTGANGSAQLRFANTQSFALAPRTVLSVHAPAGAHAHGHERSPQAAPDPAARPESPAAPPRASRTRAEVAAPAAPGEPRLDLERVVQFGRSLQVSGRVDTGASVTINGELVEVAADGRFNHFTRPFPRSGRTRLVVKATCLDGRARSLTRGVRVE